MIADEGAHEDGQVLSDDLGQAMPQSAAPPVREGMNANEVAAFLGVDRKTVYEYANRGKIPCRKLGRRLVFSRQALMAWLGACEMASSRHRKR